MALTTTQEALDQAALVLIVGDDGLYEWSATKPTEEVVAQLRRIAGDIEAAAECKVQS